VCWPKPFSQSHDDEYPPFLGDQCGQLKQCEKQFFKIKNHLQSKFTIIPQKNYKSRCYVDLSRRLLLKSHPKMAV
jgi:hypothetical protein